MAARIEDGAASVAGASAPFPLREVATLVSVVLVAAGVLVAGTQWAVSHSVDPLREDIRALQSQVTTLGERVSATVSREDLQILQSQVATLGERVSATASHKDMQSLQSRVIDLSERFSKEQGELRERVTGVEAGLREVHGRVTGVEVGLQEVHGRVTGVEAGLQEVHGRVTGVEAGLREVHGRVTGVEAGLQEVLANQARMVELILAPERRE